MIDEQQQQQSINMRYRLRQTTVRAVRWFKNGDHPEDDVMRPYEDTGLTPPEPREGLVVRYYRHPNPAERFVSGVCSACGCLSLHHGWLDSPTTTLGVVCPGDWVVTSKNGVRNAYPTTVFDAVFLPVKSRKVTK